MPPCEAFTPEPRLAPRPPVESGAEGWNEKDCGVGLAHVGALVGTLVPGCGGRRARALVREILMKAGVGAEDVSDAEVIVAELTANVERHAAEPYEVRVISVADVPIWCEVVDGSPDTEKVEVSLQRLRAQGTTDVPFLAEDTLAENGRGLLLTYRLSGGRCAVYATTTSSTGTPGKAVGFALAVGGRG
ncbi:ATP-binding protein [Sphaerisporangium sp. NPDC051017]|uniref:ATP-binding protein n=1 Tax=Sphaerisporangium sp. NPDC051017 TaxID=3154636 RepID=UPI0034412E7C